MFDFFRKRKEARQAAEARARTFNRVASQMESGAGNPLEGALVLHLSQNDDDSRTCFLITFGKSDIWVLDRGVEEPKREPTIIDGPDGHPYVAAFTSREQAAGAAAMWNFPNHPLMMPALELVFCLGPSVGIVLNAHDPHLQWTFNPQQTSNLRKVYEGSFKFESGGIYLVRSEGAWRAAKILSVDEGGVHIRLYANSWPARPPSVDPAALTLSAPGEGVAHSIGHLPLSRGAFLAMAPTRVADSPVTADELDGYNMWAEAKGGYFGA